MNIVVHIFIHKTFNDGNGGKKRKRKTNNKKRNPRTILISYEKISILSKGYILKAENNAEI